MHVQIVTAGLYSLYFSVVCTFKGTDLFLNTELAAVLKLPALPAGRFRGFSLL